MKMQILLLRLASVMLVDIKNKMYILDKKNGINKEKNWKICPLQENVLWIEIEQPFFKQSSHNWQKLTKMYIFDKKNGINKEKID